MLCVLLCLMLVFAGTVSAVAEDDAPAFGMLSMLNMTEEECVNYVLLRTLVTGVLMMEDMADSSLMMVDDSMAAEAELTEEDAAYYDLETEDED